MAYTYRIYRLPTSDPDLLPLLANKFSSLRLQALTLPPTAFASTLEVESTFPASTWISRLLRPNVHSFIAVAHPSSTPTSDQTIESGDWIGSATLLGPIPKSTYELKESGGDIIGKDGEEGKWQMTAMYNNPAHRGKGIAKLLITEVVEFARRESGDGKRTRVRIMIRPTNVVVRGLYEGLGFVEAGRCNYAEAIVANGDELPEDGGKGEPAKYFTRGGIVMEKVVV